MPSMRLPGLLTPLSCVVTLAIGQITKINIATPENPQVFYTSPDLPSFGIAQSPFLTPYYRKQVDGDTVLELCNQTITHFEQSPQYDAVGYFVTQPAPGDPGKLCSGVDHRIVVRQFIPTVANGGNVRVILNVEARAAVVIVEHLFRFVLFPPTHWWRGIWWPRMGK